MKCLSFIDYTASGGGSLNYLSLQPVTVRIVTADQHMIKIDVYEISATLWQPKTQFLYGGFRILKI